MKKPVPVQQQLDHSVGRLKMLSVLLAASTGVGSSRKATQHRSTIQQHKVNSFMNSTE
jgi:hypothetical protein